MKRPDNRPGSRSRRSLGVLAKGREADRRFETGEILDQVRELGERAQEATGQAEERSKGRRVNLKGRTEDRRETARGSRELVREANERVPRNWAREASRWND